MVRVAMTKRWLLALFAGGILASLAYSGIYQLIAVTVPGSEGQVGYVIAYRLNRFTGSVAVCDTNGCDVILGGWFSPDPQLSRDEVTPEKPARERAM
jgi:hypothetical protein